MFRVQPLGCFVPSEQAKACTLNKRRPTKNPRRVRLSERSLRLVEWNARGFDFSHTHSSSSRSVMSFRQFEWQRIVALLKQLGKSNFVDGSRTSARFRSVGKCRG